MSISKDEFLDWRNNEVTRELIKLLEVGNKMAVEELISLRGIDGDFYRGAIQTYNELLHIISTGEDLLREE